MIRRPLLPTLVAAFLGSNVPAAFAAIGVDRDDSPLQLNFQATWVWQQQRAFDAAYSGPKSLQPERARSYSLTQTTYVGWRPWRGGEWHLNVEAAQGVPFSGLQGLGGFTNGELARTSGADLAVYRARLFWRQTIDVGGSTEQVERVPNRFGGERRSRRLVFTAGNLSTIDIFDDNRFSHDPRTQFLNWSVYTHGAYDFAADARGYSWGAALEYHHDAWALRAGRFLQPRVSNGLDLNRNFRRFYGDQIELEHAHRVFDAPGKLRLLGFRGVVNGGNYQQALDAAAGGVPVIEGTTRRRDKHGLGVSLEQSVTDDIGAFLRASWNSAGAETFAFTEIDRSFSGGVAFSGSRWGRARDTLGVGFARNGLDTSHRRFLEAGGLGFFLGDGRLSYGTEQIFELYYAWTISDGVVVSPHAQRIVNPGYNRDRGPVNFLGMRVHLEM